MKNEILTLSNSMPATHFLGTPVSELTEDEYIEYQKAVESEAKIKKNDLEFKAKLAYYWGIRF